MIYRFCQLNEGKIDFQDFRTRLDLYSEHFQCGMELLCFIEEEKGTASHLALLSRFIYGDWLNTAGIPVILIEGFF